MYFCLLQETEESAPVYQILLCSERCKVSHQKYEHHHQEMASVTLSHGSFSNSNCPMEFVHMPNSCTVRLGIFSDYMLVLKILFIPPHHTLQAMLTHTISHFLRQQREIRAKYDELIYTISQDSTTLPVEGYLNLEKIYKSFWLWVWWSKSQNHIVSDKMTRESWVNSWCREESLENRITWALKIFLGFKAENCKYTLNWIN